MHKESFYGAIKREETNKKGEIEEVVKYVLRKSIDSFSDSDLKNIVDDRIKEIVTNARKEEKIIKKEIDTFKKQLNKVSDAEEVILKAKIETLMYK